MEFAGKKVVITGAAGVFGNWIAKAFAREGARLCLTDVREDALKRVTEDPGIAGHADLLIPADLCRGGEIDALVHAIERKWGAPDIVVNNAGLYPTGMLLDLPEEEWKRVFAVNVEAPFLLTRRIAKLMIDRAVKGCFVNMVSQSAYRPRIGAGHYAASKAALAMLTRAFALELAPYGIRVNAVNPGFAPGSEVSALSEEYIQIMEQAIPLKRTSGPSDAPEAILFLCSERAQYITGATLAVDGGASAGNNQLPPAVR